jgi:predicted amidohydrolase
MFLNAEWDATDRPRLPRHAAEHGMLVLLANHASSVGTYRSVGRSAAWAPGGRLLAEAADTEDALVVVTRGAGADGWSAEVVALG